MKHVILPFLVFLLVSVSYSIAQTTQPNLPSAPFVIANELQAPVASTIGVNRGFETDLNGNSYVLYDVPQINNIGSAHNPLPGKWSVLQKLSSTGLVLWSTQIKVNNRSTLGGLQIDAAGNIYILSFTDAIEMVNSTPVNYNFIKISNGGQLLDGLRLPRSASGLCLLSTGDLIFLVNSSNAFIFNGDTIPPIPGTTTNYIFAKYNSQLVYQGYHAISSTSPLNNFSYHFGPRFFITGFTNGNNGTFYISGYTSFGTIYSVPTGFQSGQSEPGFIVKYDSNLGPQWVKTIERGYFYGNIAMALDEQNNVYIGSTAPPTLQGINLGPITNTYTNSVGLLLAKFSAVDGQLLHYVVGQGDFNGIHQLKVNRAGHVYGIGNIGSKHRNTSFLGQTFGRIEGQCIVFKTDTAFNGVWLNNLNRTLYMQVFGIDGFGHVYGLVRRDPAFSGPTAHFPPFTPITQTGFNPFFVKIADPNPLPFQLLTSTNDLQKPEFRVFPNPSNGVFNLASSTGNEYAVTVINSTGQQVHHSTVSANGTLNLSHLAKGVYHLSFINGGERVNQKVVIQ